MKENNKTTVYDWPTRIFHWLFAIIFLVSFIIAETVDDESSIFAYHMLGGLTLAFLLILRLTWGFVGTTYARFSSFQLNPLELLGYLKDAVITKTKRYLGHNPASSYAAVIMFICAAGLAITGVMMTGGSESDFYEETHELLANLFLITVIVHVGGIIYHQIRHKDSLWSSMLDGRKDAVSSQKGIVNMKSFTGIVFLILTLTWMGYLNTQHNKDTNTLDLFGNRLTLGEDEHESHSNLEDFREEDDND